MEMCTHTPTNLPFSMSTFYYSCEQGPTTAFSCGPICGLHPWVFHLLGWELEMLSVTAVGVLNTASHTLPGTHSHNYLSSSKHAALWSRQLAHITAVGYTASICSFSPLTTNESLFLPRCRLPASLSCQIQAKASDLLKTLFYGGISRRPPLADSEITQWL